MTAPHRRRSWIVEDRDRPIISAKNWIVYDRDSERTLGRSNVQNLKITVKSHRIVVFVNHVTVFDAIGRRLQHFSDRSHESLEGRRSVLRSRLVSSQPKPDAKRHLELVKCSNARKIHPRFPAR